MKRLAALLVLTLFCAAETLAAEGIALPAPRMQGGMPLMQALKERKSTRAFSGRELDSQTLANLLWAAFGVNRQDSGRRTAPSARNGQEIEIYAVMKQGAFRYDAKANRLIQAASGDLRELTSTQSYTENAPLELVYVAELDRMSAYSQAAQIEWAAADTGFIAQNVYLFCASEGLVTVVRAGLDRPGLAKALGFGPKQRIVLAQTVGYPEK